ncbi:MAG: nucleotidyltransferase domain-containing protein [Candidatus Hydrogenedentes bacterium]|nr:nucleotidyltransferase domain-containing protein [Candidatus Hydrogenedentota bacterium]
MKFGVLYGSHVSGIIHEWSDIDLVIVSPRFDGEYEWEDVGKLWVLAAQTDTRIEPVPCGLRQWEEDDVNLVIEMARREGQRVEVPDH